MLNTGNKSPAKPFIPKQSTHLLATQLQTNFSNAKAQQLQYDEAMFYYMPTGQSWTINQDFTLTNNNDSQTELFFLSLSVIWRELDTTIALSVPAPLSYIVQVPTNIVATAPFRCTKDTQRPRSIIAGFKPVITDKRYS